jgi:hypothetical protein
MKLYTIYTESHRHMYENYFLKTLPDEFEVVSLEIPQECSTGEYYAEGWDKTCYRKVELFEKACEENMGGVFAFSDVDIQFFGKIKEAMLAELGDHDIACQNDTAGYHCSGFFICRANERTLKMFREMKKNYDREDQTTLNNHIGMVRSKFLSHRFFTIGHLLNTAWTGQEFDLKYEILMHHSNWVAGVENKARLMDIVRKKASERVSTIQKQLDSYFSQWRPKDDSAYPPYHEGPYLEEYFYDRFMKGETLSNRIYIPVFWTTTYTNMAKGLTDYGSLQAAISRLNPNMKYFTVAQHDDAIREKLPPDTICFNAGGNGGGIPIPLICSPIKDEMKPQPKERDIFCSFVGSMTHPIRNAMHVVLKDNDRYLFAVRSWRAEVEEDELQRFIDITSRSVFSLCPRGYGKSSFRFYEAMQLGSIPVFIYDQKWMPFEDEIDWSDFSVCIHINDIKKIDEILSSIGKEKIYQMQQALHKTWSENFTMESVYNRISERIGSFRP